MAVTDTPGEAGGGEFATGHYEERVAGTGSVRVGDEEGAVDGFGLRRRDSAPVDLAE